MAFSRVLSYSENSMNFESGVWFGLLMVLLAGGLLALRIRFPRSSRRSETAALAIGAVLFFSCCYFLLPR
jgi:hypothetical protein